MFSFNRKSKTPKPHKTEVVELHDGTKATVTHVAGPVVMPEPPVWQAPPAVIESTLPLDHPGKPAVDAAIMEDYIAKARERAREDIARENAYKADCVAQDILKYFGKCGVSEDIVKRHISIAGLPNWQMHDWPLLQRVVKFTQMRASDPQFVGALAKYYRSIGLGGTEATARFVLLHAIFEAFSEYLTKNIEGE